jgi:tetratricopeptide (TPR) repeat protein
MVQRRKQDEEFMQWLSPSYWLVEAQLYNVRARRGKETLQWARNMPEFRNWRMSDMESKERILWVRGTLGVGKSIMAGYFIDLLQYLHPTSTVAYFFCKSGQSGLTKARDILGTLAYQCIESNTEARAALEELRKKSFHVDESLGVGFLFQNLLLEPLRLAKSEIYIVVDGLDEADLTTRDVAERTARPEIDVLLECLSNLPYTRLLFISRPNANVSRVLPASITKSIGKKDNFDDIDAYVKQTIASSKTLQRHFRKEGVDPTKFFHEKANSIFLWVVLVLQQLAKAKSTSVFKKYLSGFSDASGDMERLYSALLSRFEEEDLRWVKEILKWVVVAKENLKVEELKKAVELSLDDQLPEFCEFLEVECGSILHLLQVSPDSESGSDGESMSIPEVTELEEEAESDMGSAALETRGLSLTVQLIHETLRSYLTNPVHCPKEFHVDEENTNCEALVVCLRVLSSTNRNALTNYAALNWGEHLMVINESKPMDQGTLIDLCHFFQSGGCKTWIQFGLVSETVSPRMYYPSRLPSEEERYLQGVYQCLVRWKNFNVKVDDQHGVCTAIKWVSDIVDSPWKLEEYVGKASAELWLYERMRTGETIRAFWLAVKHYCKRNGRSIDNFRDLHPLATNEFSCLVAWVDETKPKRVPQALGLAMAFHSLRLWNESTRSLRRVTQSDDPGSELERFTFLGEGCMKLRQYDEAIEAFKVVTDMAQERNKAVDPRQWNSLGLAYRAKGDCDNAIMTFEKAVEAGGGREDTPPMFLCLAEMYAAKGDYERQIGAFERAFEVRGGAPGGKWWVCQYLAEAYKAEGNHVRAKETYQRARRYFDDWASLGLHDLEVEVREKRYLRGQFLLNTLMWQMGLRFWRRIGVKEVLTWQS